METTPGPTAEPDVKQQARQEVSLDAVSRFINEQKKINTTKATNRDIKTVSDWLLREKSESRNIQNIEPKELDELLSQFFVFVRKRDGTEYQPSSLTSMLHGIDRHLRDCKYTFEGKRIDIMTSVYFEDTRKALQSKRTHLKSLGLGNRPNRSQAIDESEEKIMWERGVLGVSTPFAILFTLWYHLTLLMGLRGRDEHRKIQFGDITVNKNALGVDFLQFKERTSKTRDGSVKDDSRETVPKIFCSCASAGKEKCIVEIFRSFIQRRPSDYQKESDPFYIQFKTNEQISRSGTSIWFKREPLGVCSLSRFLPKACKLAGIAERGNHGVRATTVQRLRKAAVPDDKIIQITGHRSVRTLEVYDTNKLRDSEHQRCQQILQNNPVTSMSALLVQPVSTFPVPPVSSTAASLNPLMALTPPVTTAVEEHTANSSTAVNSQSLNLNMPMQANLSLPTSLFAGATFANCSLHIHMHNSSRDDTAEQ